MDDFNDSLVRISNSSVVALDELWTVSDASGDQVSLLDTIQDPHAADPAQEMDTTEMKDRLADAIARLPEREKLVVALYYYENLTLREIGEVLGRHRVARLAAPHEGRPAPEVPAPGRPAHRVELATARPLPASSLRPTSRRGDGWRTNRPRGSATWPWSATGAAGRRR